LRAAATPLTPVGANTPSAEFNDSTRLAICCPSSNGGTRSATTSKGEVSTGVADPLAGVGELSGSALRMANSRATTAASEGTSSRTEASNSVIVRAGSERRVVGASESVVSSI